MLIFDEATDITPKMMRTLLRHNRQQRAKDGWPNWYINHGRLSPNPSKSELRRVSWRRAH
jgi:hypothetical protein